MTLLLVLALWLMFAFLGGVLFSALVRGAGRASECLEVEPCAPAQADVPAPRASTEDRQPTRV